MANYAQIRSMDISNGVGSGVSIFFSGCDFHCKGCFNSELWDYNYGKPFTNETIEQIISLLDKPYMIRLSILGGDGMMPRNVGHVLKLIREVRSRLPHKKIWLYTGFTYEQIMFPIVTCDLNPERDMLIEMRQEVLKSVDVLIDGKFEEELKDLRLKFRGSSNQRIIDIPQTLEANKVILWNN